MAIAELNETANYSTGNIMAVICRGGWVKDYEIYSFSPTINKKVKRVPGHYYIGSNFTFKVNKWISNVTGLYNFFYIIPTIKLLRLFDKLNINLVHLHNMQHFCVSLPLLFKYTKRKKIPVIWTLHGTWTYTGGCAIHPLYNCDKWITGCHDCEYLKRMKSKPIFDFSGLMWRKKRKWTKDLNLTVVTPSEWAGECARKSFLGCHSVKVIHNGIDQYIFFPRENTNIKEKYCIGNKVMLLGVSDWWGYAKGLDVMIELAKLLDETKYQIVLVGTNENIDALLPDSIISIHRTSDKNELAELYSAADLFIMPTRAEIFGLVNVEALACGTPVITFHAGGCPEIVDDTCGAVIDIDDITAFAHAIEKETLEHNFTRENCLNRSKLFTQENMVEKYLNLYAELLK